MAETTTTIRDGRHAYRPQAIGRVFGWFFLATFVFSIPAFFAPMRRSQADASIAWSSRCFPQT